MSTVIAAVLETVTGPLLLLAWLARIILLGGAALFVLAAPFAHKSFWIALLYFAHAVAMTIIIRFLRKLRGRSLTR